MWNPAVIGGWLVAAALTSAGLFLLDDMVVSEAVLAVVLLVMGPWLAVKVRRGQVLPGVDLSVPGALILWGVAHAMEARRLARGETFAAPMVPADVLFVIVGVVLAVAATGVMWRSAQHLRLRSLLRSTLDSLLLALAVLLLFWQWVLLPRVDPRPGTLALVLTYVGVTSLMAAALLTRAVQRLEPGSWLLAVAGAVPTIGIGFWVMAKLDAGSETAASAMFLFGSLVLPLAFTHPGHRNRVTVGEVGARENLWAVGFHLGAWGTFYATSGDRPMDRLTLLLATSSVAGLFLRIFLVRLSERNLYQQLRTMAFTDSLTGAANRRGMLEALRAMPHGWLVSIDLDGFKQVNDQHGHDVGDELLLAYVRQARRLLPPETLIARVGGDEFAVLGLGPLEEGTRIAELLVRTARTLPHQGVTASGGVAEHVPGSDYPSTLRDADIALQRAKQTGKNRVETLDAQMKRHRLRELEMVRRLREDMAGSIHPYFQPVVAMADPLAPVVAAEALARWDDPALGAVPPEEFVEVCERHGLIGELGDVMLSKVLAQLEEWHAIGAPLQVAVNVSWLQLRDEACMARMRAALARVPHLAPWLVLEVTEGVLADDEDAAACLHELRELGVVTAIDDFGTGASTLTRLRYLPVDVLKVDRELVVEVGEDPSADSVLDLVRQLGAGLGLTVIVEGVESHDAHNRLVELGFHLAQGFYFHRPVPAHQVPLSRVCLGPALGRRTIPAPSLALEAEGHS